MPPRPQKRKKRTNTSDLARRITDKAAQFIESYLAPEPTEQGDSAAVVDAKSRHDSPMTNPDSPTSLWTGTAIENSAARRNKLGEKLGVAKKWLLWESIGNEKKMYEPIRAFIEFVALVVQGELSSMAGLNTRSELGRRLVLPSLPSDFKPDDADDNTRIDKGLVCIAPDSDVGAPRARPRYYDLLAVLEAKVKDDGFKGAFQQLVGYTRQMFQEQHTLRFAWGLTVSGRNVRVCHFGPDKATSSRPMSVSSLDGRRAFVETLVNWSFCEQSQLGRDPTMAYLPELGCWEIACPDDMGSADDRTRTTSYYFKVVSCHADRVFGRHTRCFLATGKKPAQMVSDENPLIPEVVIKDSWAFANPDAAADTRDEAKTLKRIKSGLSERMDCDDIIIPEIIVGGRVRFELNGKWVEDNTATMYQLCETDSTASVQLQPGEAEEAIDTERQLGEIEDDIGAQLQLGEAEEAVDTERQLGETEDSADGLNKPGELSKSSDSTFRAHRRIVMTPIGEPLRSTESVAEFVTVVCDAMRCHSAIVEHCGILHRDISDNNILVYRMGGIARGVLIDFDCAIDIKQAEREKRKEMTGTFPFMSINNLMMSDVERTSLDDWESMLCLICLYATLGTITGKRRAYEELAKFPIALWRNDFLETVLSAKWFDLSDSDTFKNKIVDHFNEDDKVELLKGLALKLYSYLFENRLLGSNYHGMAKKRVEKALREVSSEEELDESDFDELDSLPSGGYSWVNPFEERAKEWEKISGHLLSKTNRYWKKAIESQKAAIEAMNSAAVDNNSE
ncbi:hypothetical protein IWW39_001769 [Coemansia spiralis]|uniref:Fungal-type protein kinase domain-containing protein n=1 Tax=Coemansia spiralis TaxID=417178 RepID=A0A9W8GPM4_9FUNG|nr:hypothetical protein IWW39_001769 [Coemansia spiralis]